MASPNFALSRSAFSEVILANRAAAPAPERPQHVAAAEGEVVLRLRVWWVVVAWLALHTKHESTSVQCN